MTLDLMPTADRGPGEAIPSVSFARDLEVGSQAGGQAIVSSSVLPVAAATRPQTILEAGGATVVDLNTTSGTNLPMFCCKGRLMAKIYEQRFTFHRFLTGRNLVCRTGTIKYRNRSRDWLDDFINEFYSKSKQKSAPQVHL